MTFTPTKILKAPNWPQDINNVPSGGSGMPPINEDNANYIEREAFTYSTTFTFPPNTPWGTMQTQILATDQDGDFWCEQIFVAGRGTRPGNAEFLFLAPTFISLQDVRSGRYLTYNGAQQSASAANFPQSVPTELFRNLIDATTSGYDPRNYLPVNGFRPTGTLIQPFCFTRQGGIGITLQFNMNGTAYPTYTWVIDIAFSGWKEYTHAAS